MAWQPAIVLAGAAGVVAVALRRATTRNRRFAAAFAGELSLVLVLYSLWQLLGALQTVRETTGFANGYRVYDIERTLHIANEARIESWILPYSLLVQACNAYYAIVHVPALIGFLVWLFVRHRDRYPRIRNAVALVTGACLCIHFAPVAPPRLYPDLGYVDAAKLYGQSVYGTIGQGLSDQMSAMPSVHMAWALIVAVGTCTISRSRWRWLAVAHAAATAFVIVATANHWWLDGIVAGFLVAGVWGLQSLTAVVVAAVRARRVPAAIPAPA